MYTDGSKYEFGHAGSGTFIMEGNRNRKVKLMNPDHCSELIAVENAVKSTDNDTDTKNIWWILTGSELHAALML